MRIIYGIQGKQLVHFIHIGKTGGTAIKYANKPQQVNSHYKIYLHSHNFRLRDVPTGEKVVFIIYLCYPYKFATLRSQ